jgi:hypothetical protein
MARAGLALALQRSHTRRFRLVAPPVGPVRELVEDTGVTGVEESRPAGARLRFRRRMGSASAGVAFGWRASGAELAPRAAGAESRGAARSARGSSPGCGEAGVEHVPRVLDSKAVRGVGQHESRGACQQCGSAESPVQTADSSASLRESLPRKVARSLCLVNRRRDSVSSAGLGLITFPPDRSAESRPRQVAPAFGHPVMLGLARHRILHPIPTRWTAGPLACAFPRDAHEHYGLGGSSRRLLASRSRPEPPRRPRRGPLRNHGGRVWPSIGFSFNQASELP